MKSKTLTLCTPYHENTSLGGMRQVTKYQKEIPTHLPVKYNRLQEGCVIVENSRTFTPTP